MAHSVLERVLWGYNRRVQVEPRGALLLVCIARVHRVTRAAAHTGLIQGHPPCPAPHHVPLILLRPLVLFA
jgi:hypothetical protein